MEHIYEDVEFITGEEGVMTHQLPNAFRAMQPWLRAKVQDPRFWDEAYDTTHVGEHPIQPMDEAERAEFFCQMKQLPSALELIGTAR